MKNICEVDLSSIDETNYRARHAGAIVLSSDGKIILQQRPENWRTFPGCLSTFGGKIENMETPMQALIRELAEELGAKVRESDVMFLGAVTEKIVNHQDLIYMHYWQDKLNTITGCYECEAIYYDDASKAFSHPKIMDAAYWALKMCQQKKLLPKL